MTQFLLQTALVLAQVLLLVCLAPLVAGFANQLTLIWREQSGWVLGSWYQKLRLDARAWAAGPDSCSWCARWYLMAVFLAATLLFNFLGQGLSYGDAFTLVLFLVLGRLARWLTVPALTAGGRSRELFWTGFSLPVWLLAVMAAVAKTGSTMPANMIFKFEGGYFNLSALLAAIAFFGLILALNGPVLEPLRLEHGKTRAAGVASDKNAPAVEAAPSPAQSATGELKPVQGPAEVAESAPGNLLVTLADSLQLLVYLLFFVEVYLPLPGFLILRLILAAGILGGVAAYRGRCRALKPASLLVDVAVLFLAALMAQ